MTILLLTSLALCSAEPASGAVPAGYDPFLRAVPVSRFSFEANEDRDYDDHPDDWSRRTGPGFPGYIRAGIDRTHGADGRQSLEIEANGGQAVLYSPAITIDPHYSWLMEASVRTQELTGDAAIVSISFLNHKRQRVERILSQPVTGTHDGWVKVRIGPVEPSSDVRYVVLGCHLASGRNSDIGGSAWFDNLRLLKLPQLRLASNFQTHFRRRFAEIEIRADVGGLDSESAYSLTMETINSAGVSLARVERHLTDGRPAIAEIPPEPGAPIAPAPPPESTSGSRESVTWKLPSQDYGYYAVRASLSRDGQVILRSETSFAVLDLVDPETRGEFGWSMESGSHTMNLSELADVATQSGINWVKYPVWQSVFDSDKERPAKIAEFFDLLSYRGIGAVGMLSDPPPEIRGKFARDWAGVSEIFTMPAQFWGPAIEPVLARYSTNVQHWQLGGDADNSFVGLKSISANLRTIKKTCDRIGRDSRLGVSWGWDAEWPPGRSPPQTFLTLDGSAPLLPHEMIQKLKATREAGVLRWVTLRPLSSTTATDEFRAADLVKRMTAARIGGADAIIAADVFHPETGLLTEDGSPTRLFLPWRTTAVALQGATYLGSLVMQNQSENHVFSRRNELVIVIWNDRESEESIYLGEDVIATDTWGRQSAIPLDPKTGTQNFDVGPTPLILRGCSEAIARWRMETRFEKGRVASAYGEHRDAIVGVNTFSQGVNGRVTVTFPPDWEVEPRSWPLQVAAGERFRLPMTLTLPPNASLGNQETMIAFDIVADRPYRFRMYQPYEVGLGDIHLAVTDRRRDDNRLEIEQVITNQTDPPEILNFRCSLFVPGHKRQVLSVTKLGQGQDRKFFHLPEAESLRGQEFWIRAEQVDGRRVLNFKWIVGKDWENQKDPSRRLAPNQRAPRVTDRSSDGSATPQP